MSIKKRSIYLFRIAYSRFVSLQLIGHLFPYSQHCHTFRNNRGRQPRTIKIR